VIHSFCAGLEKTQALRRLNHWLALQVFHSCRWGLSSFINTRRQPMIKKYFTSLKSYKRVCGKIKISIHYVLSPVEDHDLLRIV
jgi:hypothetical protein